MNFLDEENVDIMDFWESEEILFNARSWQKDISVVSTKLE